jgi:hypothetical protein
MHRRKLKPPFKKDAALVNPVDGKNAALVNAAF